ncbi:MAG: hypothetical protein M2R45_04755 [Verrucomicrobia subdivision 3 bacterium]|nr:hypothetical protein [Limisphaerales bacterium]MCS1415084.1 hypothetical protein [Limisphaerales bacterium]
MIVTSNDCFMPRLLQKMQSGKVRQIYFLREQEGCLNPSVSQKKLAP